MRWLVVATLIATAFAGCSSQGFAPMSVEAPEWSPGHTWTYEWEGSYTWEGEHEREEEWEASEEPIVWTVLAPGSAEGKDGWYVQQSGYDSPGLIGTSYGELLFIDNATLLPENGVAMLDGGCWDYCGYDSEMADSGQVYLPFPIDSGDDWLYDDWQGTYQAVAQGRSTVEVAGEAVPTMHIRFTHLHDDPAEEIAQMEEYGAVVHKYLYSITETYDIDYAPSIENVVKIRHQIQGSFDIHIEWDDDEFKDAGTVSGTSQWYMTDYELAETEAWTEAELLDEFGYEDIYEPYPLMPIHNADEVDIVIEGGGTEHNVENEERVELTAWVDHENATDYDLYYALTKPDEYSYAYAYYYGLDDFTSGNTVSFDVDEIGTYEVQFVAAHKNATSIAGYSMAEVQGYFEQTLHATCELSAPYWETPCDEILFPVTQYDQYVTVHAEYSQDVGVGSARLYLLDPTGSEGASKNIAGGEATIEGNFCCGTGKWSAHVQPGTTTGGSVTYTVRVDSTDDSYMYYYH